jgi:hypothetical protein
VMRVTISSRVRPDSEPPCDARSCWSICMTCGLETGETTHDRRISTCVFANIILQYKPQISIQISDIMTSCANIPYDTKHIQTRFCINRKKTLQRILTPYVSIAKYREQPFI